MSKIFLILIIGLWMIINSKRVVPKDKFNSEEIEFKGITFVGDKYCPEVSYEDPLALASMQKLKETGANWVAIVVTEYQDYLNSTEIYPLYIGNYIKNEYYTYKTESLVGLTNLINFAHSIGLKVMMKPHLDLSRENEYDKIWRGNIGEQFTTQSEWNQWFKSYQSFILKYAKLSEKLKVEMFSVSCELIATNKQTENWRKIIKEIRKVYSNLLIDSANHDGEEYQKLWWDDLDYIGVDAYYLPIQSTELVKISKDFESQLKSSIDKLRNLSEKFNKKVIITEIGFCSGNCRIKNRLIKPNLSDHYLQAFYYETFIKIFYKEDFISGFFWWAWNSDTFYGDADDNCISPQHKMAEFVLRNYYGGDVDKMSYTKENEAKCKCTI